MHWNHRVMAHTDDMGETYYTIHEVYYDDSGQPDSWTEKSVPALGYSLDELRGELEQMLAATYKPTLDYPSN